MVNEFYFAQNGKRISFHCHRIFRLLKMRRCPIALSQTVSTDYSLRNSRTLCCHEIASNPSTATGVLKMVTERNFAEHPELGVRTAERRQSCRLHLQIPMFVRGTDAYGEEFIELVKTLDISATGACLTLPRPVRKLELVTLTIPTPSVTNSGLVPASMAPISARVIRQKEVGDIHLVGVQFLRPLS